jgi:hypothetical protein
MPQLKKAMIKARVNGKHIGKVKALQLVQLTGASFRRRLLRYHTHASNVYSDCSSVLKREYQVQQHC